MEQVRGEAVRACCVGKLGAHPRSPPPRVLCVWSRVGEGGLARPVPVPEHALSAQGYL